MKRLMLVLSMVVFLMVPVIANADGVIKKRVRCEGGERLTISLYNGRECERARVVIKTSGTTTYAINEIELHWDTPSGYHRKKTFTIHPEEQYTHEIYICMKGDDPEPGTGVLYVICGYDEVLYVEFTLRGKYIRFKRR